MFLEIEKNIFIDVKNINKFYNLINYLLKL